MNTNAAWKCLSVKEFVARCNWHGFSPKLSNAVKQSIDLTTWQCLTTQEFFTLNNWDGRSLLTNIEQVDDDRVITFDLILPTSQFWQCFNWSGELHEFSEVDKTIKDTEKVVAAVEKFTLNDLSQLF